MKNNIKILKLAEAGFKTKNLMSMTERQINVLHSRLMEQVNPVTSTKTKYQIGDDGGSLPPSPKGYTVKKGSDGKVMAEPNEGEMSEEGGHGWGSSDQGYFNRYIHEYLGEPNEMPSPFESDLEDAASEAVDNYWDEWEEYKTDREGLVDHAKRGYLRSYFKEKFDMLVKMFEPAVEDEELEAWNNEFGDDEEIYNELDENIYVDGLKMVGSKLLKYYQENPEARKMVNDFGSKIVSKGTTKIADKLNKTDIKDKLGSLSDKLKNINPTSDDIRRLGNVLFGNSKIKNDVSENLTSSNALGDLAMGKITGQLPPNDEDDMAPDGMDDDSDNNRSEMQEKAVSKQQQKFFGVVKSMQDGDTPKEGEAGDVAKEMSKKDVMDFVNTKLKGLPKKKKKKETKENLKFESIIERKLIQIVEKHLPTKISKKDFINLVSESPEISPVRPTVKPGTKPKRPSTPYKPKPGPKPAPKAEKNDIPEWLSFNKIGVKLK